MLLVTCTHYPWLDSKGSAQVFALFAKADDSIFQIKLSFIKLQSYDIKMLYLE